MTTYTPTDGKKGPVRTGLEIHIWMGIQPPIYQLVGVMQIMGPPVQVDFSAANDEENRR